MMSPHQLLHAGRYHELVPLLRDRFQVGIDVAALTALIERKRLQGALPHPSCTVAWLKMRLQEIGAFRTARQEDEAVPGDAPLTPGRHGATAFVDKGVYR